MEQTNFFVLLYKKDYTGEAFFKKNKRWIPSIQVSQHGLNLQMLQEEQLCHIKNQDLSMYCYLSAAFGDMDYKCWIEQINMYFNWQQLLKISSLLAYSMSYMANILFCCILLWTKMFYRPWDIIWHPPILVSSDASSA